MTSKKHVLLAPILSMRNRIVCVLRSHDNPQQIRPISWHHLHQQVRNWFANYDATELVFSITDYKALVSLPDDFQSVSKEADSDSDPDQGEYDHFLSWPDEGVWWPTLCKSIKDEKSEDQHLYCYPPRSHSQSPAIIRVKNYNYR